MIVKVENLQITAIQYYITAIHTLHTILFTI